MAAGFDGSRVEVTGGAHGSRDGGQVALKAPDARVRGGRRRPAGWSRDGRELVYVETVRKIDGGSGTSDIFAVSLADKTTRPLVQTKGQNAFPAVSPDGRWLAYSSGESGQLEVMVQPY